MEFHQDWLIRENIEIWRKDQWKRGQYSALAGRGFQDILELNCDCLNIGYRSHRHFLHFCIEPDKLQDKR
jgi:hypothetical protein